ncbi:methylesterase 10 [Physcomitrium patens]|uniref:AB hydrolase-1 domain-containing protein n=1 Tax=Physcomitrium patens TaxID=3218 RepID=A0A2K1IGE5_PHYPA|nr:methylesterase 18-like isoform X1 [Physcomitrium patens]PNR28350.1 hypothetical protein PHYPA_028942 [Physcomitrium patens]|eukprot:XP_024363716.1 methylesterase 18-like isoform X1 [Physcomitrella patens]
MHVLNPLRILPLVSRRVEDLRFACLWSAELVPWCCWLRVGLEIRLEVEVEDRMAHHHFVLIHGGCYGAWAWCKLEDCLQRKGCKVTALDMTGAGIHPADPDSITTYEEYHQPALIFFESVPEGNLDKMSKAPAPFCKRITFNFKNGIENAPTSFYYPTSELRDVFYGDCDSQDIVLASKLVRPYPNRMLATPITYTQERHGQVPAVYIKYSQDNAFPPQAQEYMVSHYGPFQEVIELEGSHFNFWARVDDFTTLIVSLANKYTTQTSSPVYHATTQVT